MSVGVSVWISCFLGEIMTDCCYDLNAILNKVSIGPSNDVCSWRKQRLLAALSKNPPHKNKEKKKQNTKTIQTDCSEEQAFHIS